MTFHNAFLRELFTCIRNRESCVVVAASSMGKTRLLDVVMQHDIRREYLKADSDGLLLARTDCNRVSELNDWGLYELVLTALIEGISSSEAGGAIRKELSDLRRDVILNKNGLLAQRHLETALHVLCVENNFRFAILLDEFDALYRNLSSEALANLRGFRDMVKTKNYALSYVLMMRDDPARLRDPGECEGFYELISRHIIGLKPCEREDALMILDHAQQRRSINLSEKARESILSLSGGHPGLIDALTTAAGKSEQVLEQPQIEVAIEECRKIWAGLADDERILLSKLVSGIHFDKKDSALEALELKGIIKNDRVFSPLLEKYISQNISSGNRKLHIDEQKYVVWVGNHSITNLSLKEFNLIKLLFSRAGDVVRRDEILGAIYPEEKYQDSETDDNRLDAMIKRLRTKIEPVPSKPEYLVTVPSVGYKLVTG